jgi:hypothetical protein
MENQGELIGEHKTTKSHERTQRESQPTTTVGVGALKKARNGIAQDLGS